MTVRELETALAAKAPKRMAERVLPGQAPQTARALLEENKQLIQEKQGRKALAKKSSREFVERLIEHDRLSTEVDKTREAGRKQTQQELACYYKAKIAEKEQAKAGEYRSKVDNGVEIQYFPFVEGEGISRSREVDSQKQRDEMRDFFRRQREQRPPRSDVLLREASLEHQIPYALGGASSSAAPGPPDEGPGPHLAQHPRFLSRAREHMSRRLHDAHVRKALEEKVHQTQQELEHLSRRRRAEQQQWEEGLLVNDALRFDSYQAKAADRRHHAQFLRSQMEERRARDRSEKEAKHAEEAGYFGPEEKEVQGSDLHREHCADLIKQMEVDQRRRACSRSHRLQQERVLIDNCMAEMSQDREKERQKAVQHRTVLTTTWKSQQKIKHALKAVDVN